MHFDTPSIPKERYKEQALNSNNMDCVKWLAYGESPKAGFIISTTIKVSQYGAYKIRLYLGLTQNNTSNTEVFITIGNWDYDFINAGHYINNPVSFFDYVVVFKNTDGTLGIYIHTNGSNISYGCIGASVVPNFGSIYNRVLSLQPLNTEYVEGSSDSECRITITEYSHIGVKFDT